SAGKRSRSLATLNGNRHRPRELPDDFASAPRARTRTDPHIFATGRARPASRCRNCLNVLLAALRGSKEHYRWDGCSDISLHAQLRGSPMTEQTTFGIANAMRRRSSQFANSFVWRIAAATSASQSPGPSTALTSAVSALSSDASFLAVCLFSFCGLIAAAILLRLLPQEFVAAAFAAI